MHLHCKKSSLVLGFGVGMIWMYDTVETTRDLKFYDFKQLHLHVI